MKPLTWEIEDAERQFEELVRRAIEDGPQVVARDGEDIFVVVKAEEYRRSQQDPSSINE